jgi:UDP-GlcNAc:undecaprenyl-phosphate/decaprenyl-phosphate GlcNAc-1-phosphate transferase
MALIWFFIAFFTLAMIVSLCITPIVRSAALRFGLVDEPDGRRKMHSKPIPVAGGVAVLITSVIMFTALFAFAAPIRSSLKSEIARASFDSVVTLRPELIGLAIAAAIIGLVGVVDDLVGLRGGHKLLGQLLAVSVVIFTGVKFDTINVFGWTIDLGIMTIPITIFWLLGAINALNLIDGLDGMLGSIGCIVCGSFAALAYLSGQVQAAFVATAVAGSLLGFLFFNFPPATIFLGDCGSMLVGLVVGVLGIESSLKGAAAASLAAPAALLVIPIFDTSAAIIRRWLTGRSIYSTDRAHLHHRLIDSGFSNRQVLLLVGVICLLASAGAIASQALKSQMVALLALLGVMTTLVVTRLFGHAEFLLIKVRIWGALTELRRSGRRESGNQMEVRLQGSGDWNELWRRVIAAAEDSQFKSVCLDVNAPALKEGYHARWGRVHSDDESPCYWKAQIPLAAAGQIVGRLEVVGLRNGQAIGESIAEVGRLVADLEATMGDLTGFASAPNLKDSQAGRVDRPRTPVIDAIEPNGAILPPPATVFSESTVANRSADS